MFKKIIKWFAVDMKEGYSPRPAKPGKRPAATPAPPALQMCQNRRNKYKEC